MTDIIPLKLQDDTASVLERGTVAINVLANDQGTGLQIIGYSDASGATLTQDSSHNLVYTADAQKFFTLTPGHTMTDVITYQVQDVTGAVSTAHAVVTIGGAPNSPDIYGTRKADVLIGTDGDEVIYAGKGGDAVLAQGGADTIYGGDGKDILFGGDGDDLVVGGGGSDTLWGNYGDDTLVGGKGADNFAFEDFWGQDIVLGFDPKKDTIQLPAVYYTNWKQVLADAKEVFYYAPASEHGAADHDDHDNPSDHDRPVLHENLVITTAGHDGNTYTITLVDVDMRSLHSSNFVFI